MQRGSFTVYSGTFAVVSLMVGQVVNRGYQMHLGQVAEIVNTTASTLDQRYCGGPGNSSPCDTITV